MGSYMHDLNSYLVTERQKDIGYFKMQDKYEIVTRFNNYFYQDSIARERAIEEMFRSIEGRNRVKLLLNRKKNAIESYEKIYNLTLALIKETDSILANLPD